jgi:hypothetical protein
VPVLDLTSRDFAGLRGTLRDFAGLRGTSRDFAGFRGIRYQQEISTARKETHFFIAPRNGRGERGGYGLLKGRMISWVNPRFFFAGTALDSESESDFICRREKSEKQSTTEHWDHSRSVNGDSL